jgi:ribonuclease T2
MNIRKILLSTLLSKVTSDIIYVFAYSWKPGYCYTTNPDYPGCLEPKEYWKYNLTIHGLWPQYDTTGYPSYCSTESFDTNVPYEIGWDTMTTYFPDMNYAETSPDYDSFWEHEWDKHGTCSGLSQYDYFSETINLSKIFITPSIIDKYINTTGKLLSDDLRNELGGKTYVALKCDSSSIFTEAYTCWTQTSFKQIECPSSVLSEDTCHSEYLSIYSL